MRIIKKVTVPEHVTLFNCVNTPPRKQGGYTKADEKRLDELFNIITMDIKVDAAGMYLFGQLKGPRNLKLSEAAWSELKKCFELAAYPTYHILKEARVLEDRILNAQFIEDKQE